VEQTSEVARAGRSDFRSRAAGLLFLLLITCLPAATQTAPLHDIHVEKQPGQQTGPALVTVNGKVRRVMRNALQAWPVRKGEDALILAPAATNAGNAPYRLLFFDGATRQRRILGSVPFDAAEVSESERGDGTSIFVLSGSNGNEPVVVVAGMEAIHARLTGAVNPKLGSDALTYVDKRSGRTRVAPLASLMATDMSGIYEWHANGPGNSHYVQFLRDGTAILAESNGNSQTGTWWTDGEVMVTTLSDGSRFEWRKTLLTHVTGVPAGARLVLRLLQPLSSLKNKEGDPIDAVLISPVSNNGQTLLPQGSQFAGTIAKAHGVGWGVRHETAALTVDFNKAKLPNGNTVFVHTRLSEVENSREKVNDKGTIQGIRSTDTLGRSAESKIASLAAFDPIAYLFTTVSATAALGFAEPEILYPAGTEVVVQLTTPLITSKAFPSAIPPLASSPAERGDLVDFVRKVPFRTVTQTGNKPSDLTNLLFIGSPGQLRQAFHAAGWVPADELNAITTFETLKSISGNKTYNQAPMSTLLLDERPPLFNFTKTTNTFSARHHLRVFDPDMRYQGKTVLTASSTQDIGIAFSAKQKTFIHVIDEYIDNERSKVVNDLGFTGCVEAMELVPRSWAPRDAHNSTGDRLRTDGAIAVLRLKDCSNPRTTPTDNAVPPSRFERIIRDTMLTLRNDVWRGNIGYQGVTGAIKARNYLATRDVLKPGNGAWQTIDLSGAEFKGAGDVSEDRQTSVRTENEVSSEQAPPQPAGDNARSHRWDPPRYEISLQGGYLRYPNIRAEAVGVVLTPDAANPDLPVYGIILADDVDGGWTAGISFTANTWRWVSNEFSYHYQRGKYELLALDFDENTEPEPQVQQVGLVTRQFEYNVLVHARPRESRWRPYVAVGPVLQLISLSDAPIKRAAGPFKLGLQNVGVLKAAFDFGGTPPLEGGGIFQLGLQYGAGIKFRVHPRITIRADYRETWSKNPEFIKDSYTDDYFDVEGYDSNFFRAGTPSKFRQQRFTLGVGFTF
jgi:opacity protein-like surface antigen